MPPEYSASGDGTNRSACCPSPLCCCLVYQRLAERDEEVTRYLKYGFALNEKAVVVMPSAWQVRFRRGLEKYGLQLGDFEESGRLTIVSPKEIGLLTAATAEQAVDCLGALESRVGAEGYTGLRLYWEMAGAVLEKDPHWLRELIAGCDHWIAREKVALLAGFDRQRVASGLLVDVLPLFPSFMKQGRAGANNCYRPPDSLPPAARVLREVVGGLRQEDIVQGERQSKRPYRRGQVLDALFAAAPIGIWLLDKDQRMVFVNRNFCAATGISGEQFLQARHYSEVMSPDVAVECMLSDQRAYLADGPVEAEEPIRDSDGREHIFRVVKNTVVDSDQQIEGMLGLAIDITEQKEVECRLRNSEKRFRDIALSMADFIWEIDASGRFTYCSDNVEEMLGYSAQDLCGRSCFELFSAREARRLEQLFCAPDASHKAFRNLQSWAYNRRGEKRSLSISGVPIVSDQGIFAGYRGVTEDITDRKRAEAGMQRALVETEQARDLVDSIIKSTVDGLIVTGPRDHTIMLINDSARDLLCLGGQELVGQPVVAALQDAGLQRQIEAIYREDAPPLIQADFCLVRTAVRERKVLLARTSLMRNKQGRINGAITMLRDVTRERELERHKAEFMSMAAHELRTPLTAILGYAELCMDPDEFGGFSASQQKEFLAEINSKAEVLAKLVNDLLDISRLEAGRPLPLQIEKVAVEPFLNKVVEGCRLLAPKHAFELVLATDAPKQVLADAGKLEQVLENVLSNAVKYSPEGSRIGIYGQRSEGSCQISVVDQGIGMSAEQVERVFDKFYRADSSNTAARGLGLGMSLSRQIVEQHGGKIWVESVAGEGTRVTFSLPVPN